LPLVLTNGKNYYTDKALAKFCHVLAKASLGNFLIPSVKTDGN